ncbi:MAG: hypothetical protein HQ475_12330 [SAR202 cluster bacterium]|nr:hypothetical protein [SAR202 cluster bacterium]
MKFEDAVANISTLTDLRRIAGAHVVDHRQLTEDELREALVKVKPQYLHDETIRQSLETALYQNPRNDLRVLSYSLLIDVLLDQYDFLMPSAQAEERVIAFEQAIVNRSNETELSDLAAGNSDSQRFRDIDLYFFVLGVAWENEDAKSADEVNLLRKLRTRLDITESDHRLLEAKLGKYPKPLNSPHTRTEIGEARRYLQGLGLLFSVRQDGDINLDVIPEEIAVTVREVFGVEVRSECYAQLMEYRPLRRKSNLIDVLTQAKVEFGRYDTIDTLVERVLRYVPASKAIASNSPRFGLNSDQLAAWCRQLNLSPSGAMEERVARVIGHFDQLQPKLVAESDEREYWYGFFEELASRQYDFLRAQHVIEKDLEIEAKFEDATSFLFEKLLNHTPLQQRGTAHPDGLLSLQMNYLMWDNKSKESPVNLKDHLAQFDGYMNQADKPVPAFLVIGPEFTDDSETEAIRYHAQHFNRNLVLITAKELKNLADEWSSPANKQRETGFNLGLLAATGRYKRDRLGKIV